MLHMIIDVDYVVKKARQNSYNGRCECKGTPREDFMWNLSICACDCNKKCKIAE